MAAFVSSCTWKTVLIHVYMYMNKKFKILKQAFLELGIQAHPSKESCLHRYSRIMLWPSSKTQKGKKRTQIAGVYRLCPSSKVCTPWIIPRTTMPVMPWHAMHEGYQGIPHERMCIQKINLNGHTLTPLFYFCEVAVESFTLLYNLFQNMVRKRLGFPSPPVPYVTESYWPKIIK